MLWIALASASPPEDGAAGPAAGAPTPAAPDASFAADATALAWRALVFTPRVIRLEEAVLMDIAASQRLFGGAGALLARFFEEKEPIPSVIWSYGATEWIAIGRLRAAPLQPLQATDPVDGAAGGEGAAAVPAAWPAVPPPEALPLGALSAARPHLATLAGLGCRSWGDLRALPRGGVVRRFGEPLLAALDQAFGLRPIPHDWITLPEQFDEPLELPQNVDTAPALLFGARRLLARLHAWLRARRLGLLGLELVWQIDRRRDLPPEGRLPVRTTVPTLDLAHIERLLAEHLAHVTLPAPVQALRLRTLETAPLPGDSASLLPDPRQDGDSLHALVERLGARLGAHQVQAVEPVADHRPERMLRWLPVSEAPKWIANNDRMTMGIGQKTIKPPKRKAAAPATAPSGRPQPAGAHPQPAEELVAGAPPGRRQAPPEPGGQPAPPGALYPSWLLERPLRLVVQRHRPLYQGPLTLLVGPQRLESGWWDADATGSAAAPAALRDYFIARSPQAGLLWVFRERLPQSAEPGWYLHGLFA
jgi:protein ImuB